MAAKEKVIDGWGKVAETIVEMMLAGTLEKDDVDFTISHEKLRAEVSEKLRAEVSIENYDQGDILFDKAIEILGYERRISGELDDKKELSYSWGQGCFLGFSPSAKKPSGVSLPPRTWEVAKQLMDKVNQVKEDEITDRLRNRLRNIKGSITFGQLIDDIENDDIVTYGTGNPILEVALNRPGNINTSEIFELAIEVLKANLWPRQEG